MSDHLEFPTHPGATLREARDWVKEHQADGVKCPACSQLAKVYRRALHASMAAQLIRFSLKFGSEWGSRVALTRGRAEGDFAKLRYWGLVNESDEQRPDGGRAGWWQVTDLGARFVAESVLVRKYVYVFDGRPVHLPGGTTFDGPYISIRTALGKRFDYNALMGRAL